MDDHHTNHVPTNRAALLADATAQPLIVTAQPLNEMAELSDADGELAGRTQASEPRPPLPLTPEDLLAGELIAVMDDFSSRFPGLVYPTEKEEGRVRGHRTVPKIFMQRAMSTVSETILKRTRNVRGISTSTICATIWYRAACFYLARVSAMRGRGSGRG